VECSYLNMDMCKFESSQKDESKAPSTDSSKAYSNTSANTTPAPSARIMLQKPIPQIVGRQAWELRKLDKIFVNSLLAAFFSI